MSLTALALSSTPGPPTKPVIEFLAAVTKFIPGDILTVYLSALALYQSAYPGAGLGHVFNKWLPDPQGAFFWVFIACLVFTVVWVIGLRYMASSSANPFVWPLWPTIAGFAAFYVYAIGVDNTNDGHNVLASGLLVLFGSTILVFLNGIVLKRWPDQGVP